MARDQCVTEHVPSSLENSSPRQGGGSVALRKDSSSPARQDDIYRRSSGFISLRLYSAGEEQNAKRFVKRQPSSENTRAGCGYASRSAASCHRRSRQGT